MALVQVRGDADANVALAQLDLIQNDPRVHFAGTQWEFQGVWGSHPGIDHVHLSPQGYTHLGQSIGTYLGKALTGRPEAPILINEVTAISPQDLLVRFSGVEGQLVEDPSIFAGNPDLAAPAHFAFTLTDRNRAPAAQIADSRIVGADTVLLSFDRDLSGELRLWLGLHGQELSGTLPARAFESDNGTTLRDSEISGGMFVPEEYDGGVQDVVEFAPLQSHDFWLSSI